MGLKIKINMKKLRKNPLKSIAKIATAPIRAAAAPVAQAVGLKKLAGQLSGGIYSKSSLKTLGTIGQVAGLATGAVVAGPTILAGASKVIGGAGGLLKKAGGLLGADGSEETPTATETAQEAPQVQQQQQLDQETSQEASGGPGGSRGSGQDNKLMLAGAALALVAGAALFSRRK